MGGAPDKALESHIQRVPTNVSAEYNTWLESESHIPWSVFKGELSTAHKFA